MKRDDRGWERDLRRTLDRSLGRFTRRMQRLAARHLPADRREEEERAQRAELAARLGVAWVRPHFRRMLAPVAVRRKVAASVGGGGRGPHR